MRSTFAILSALAILLPGSLAAQRVADAASGARAAYLLVSSPITGAAPKGPGIGAAQVGSVSRRDHVKGALYGAAIGAVVGGLGFAAINYAYTTSSPRNEFTLLSLIVGGAGGGTVGMLVGAIWGVPEHRAPRPETAAPQ